MSLRKTACASCVTAKRRCDRARPTCSRCDKQSLKCDYPYPVEIPALPAAPSTEPETASINTDSQSSLQSQLDDLVSTWNTEDFGTTDYGIEPWTYVGDDESLNSSLDLFSYPSTLPPFDPNILEIEPTPSLSARDYGAVDNLMQHTLSYGQRHDVDLYDEEPLQENSRHTRKVRYRNRYLSQMRTSAPLLRPRPFTEDWPHGRDMETWTFCAGELLSLVRFFSRTASTTFIQTHGPMKPPLRQALGICAAYETLGEVNRSAFEDLLAAGIDDLIQETNMYESQGVPLLSATADEIIAIFREHLARVQAMTLYQIIRLFSPDPQQRLIAEQQVPLLASWTRELILQVQAIQKLMKRGGLDHLSMSWASSVSNDASSTGDFRLVSDEGLNIPGSEPPLQKSEIEHAYRTILISYLARGVYTTLVYQRCPMLGEMGTLPLMVPPSEKVSANDEPVQAQSSNPRNESSGQDQQALEIKTMTYADVVSSKEFGRLDIKDRFFLLPLIACKGVSMLKT